MQKERFKEKSKNKEVYIVIYHSSTNHFGLGLI